MDVAEVYDRRSDGVRVRVVAVLELHPLMTTTVVVLVESEGE